MNQFKMCSAFLGVVQIYNAMLAVSQNFWISPRIAQYDKDYYILTHLVCIAQYDLDC